MSRKHPRRLLGALPALVAYLYALVAAPWVHAHHHALHGADHVHEAAGARALLEAPDAGSATTGLESSAAHAGFHADLAALGLDDVAGAGTLSVDCDLADYTLTDCSAPESSTHAARFGDTLVAHQHPRPLDLAHGRGSLEHLTKALLCPHPIVLPPRSAPLAGPKVLLVEAQRTSIAARAPRVRGPPLRS